MRTQNRFLHSLPCSGKKTRTLFVRCRLRLCQPSCNWKAQLSLNNAAGPPISILQLPEGHRDLVASLPSFPIGEAYRQAQVWQVFLDAAYVGSIGLSGTTEPIIDTKLAPKLCIIEADYNAYSPPASDLARYANPYIN